VDDNPPSRARAALRNWSSNRLKGIPFFAEWSNDYTEDRLQKPSED
jgi:hypothetical protein